jgi:hypothetical protein
MKISTTTSYLLSACLIITLSGCANQGSSSMPINHGNYVPHVNLTGEALKAYHADVAVCQQQILQQYGDKYTNNNAIIDVRHCLIKKGYVLLS